jgi:hypothetical protein
VLKSRSGDWIARGIRNANPILPDDVRQWLGKYIDELDEKLHAPPNQPPAKSDQPELNQGRGATAEIQKDEPTTTQTINNDVKGLQLLRSAVSH